MSGSSHLIIQGGSVCSSNTFGARHADVSGLMSAFRGMVDDTGGLSCRAPEFTHELNCFLDKLISPGSPANVTYFRTRLRGWYAPRPAISCAMIRGWSAHTVTFSGIGGTMHSRRRYVRGARNAYRHFCAMSILFTAAAMAQTASLFEERYGIEPDLARVFHNNWNASFAFEAAYTDLCADGTPEAVARVNRACNDGSELVLCADGSRPVFYWDAGSGPGRDRWVIYSGQGGANCTSDPAPGKPNCWQLYLEDRTHFNNGLNFQGGVFSYPSQFGAREGILRPDDPVLPGESMVGDCKDGHDNDGDGRTDDADPKCSQSNPFKSMNRIFVDKCTPDLWTGQNARAPYPDSRGLTGEDGNPEDEANRCDDGIDNDGDASTDCADPDCACASDIHINYQGHQIVEQVMRTLLSRTITATSPNTGDLPPFGNADLVLFTAHSGGSRGLVYNLDHWNEYVTGELGVPARVRGLFSSSEMFTVRTERFFAEQRDPTSESIYHAPWRTMRPTPVSYEAGGCRGAGALEDDCFNTFTYERGKTMSDLAEWGVALDRTCLIFHRNNTAHCADPAHVRQNHLNTPFFLNKSQTDPSEGAASLPICQLGKRDQSYDCNYIDHPDDMQMLLRKQFADIHLDAETERCEARFFGSFPYDQSVIYATASADAVHAGVDSDPVFFGSFAQGGRVIEFRAPPADGVCQSADVSINQALSRWLDNGLKGLYMDDAAVLSNGDLNVCP